MSEHSAQVKTVKVSINKLTAYKSAAMQFGSQNAANIDSKLWYAITRSEKEINGALKPLFDLNNKEQEEIDDIMRDNQATDVNGVLLYQLAPDKNGEIQKVRQYTAAGEKKRDVEIKKCRERYNNQRNVLLFDENGEDNTVEIRVHVSPEYPNGMHESFVSVFRGIVLDDESKEKVKLQMAKA